jgi:hypothetical protein
MSSQGPKVSGTVAINGNPILNTLPASASVSAGYAYDKDAVRDAGDWIRLKKELLVFNENKSKNFQDPWFVRGNGYRLTWMQGRSKQASDITGCVACSNGSAFVGGGPF